MSTTANYALERNTLKEVKQTVNIRNNNQREKQ